MPTPETTVTCDCPFWGPLLTGAVIAAVAVLAADHFLPSEAQLDVAEAERQRQRDEIARGQLRRPRRDNPAAQLKPAAAKKMGVLGRAHATAQAHGL